MLALIFRDISSPSPLPPRLLFPGVVLQEKNGSRGSIVIRGGQNRQTGVGGKQLFVLAVARWMSAVDMLFPLKQIFVLLSANEEAVCCHGGDRQEGLGVCCSAGQHLFYPRWRSGLLVLICPLSSIVAEEAGRELVGPAGCMPHLRPRRPWPCWLSCASSTHCRTTKKCNFAAPGLV